MNVLFIGPDSGTSRHRFFGFNRLRHNVRLIDPRQLLPSSVMVDRFVWKIHPAPIAAIVRPRLLRLISGQRYDLAFVDGGILVNAELVRDLQARGARVVNFNHDDPYGSRDGVLFATYRSAVSQYDLVVVVRKENVAEARLMGARRVLHTFRVADDVEHSPRILTPAIREQWESHVAFIGTWMPERGPFLVRLLQRGVPLSIFGGRWQKAPEWPALHSAHRGNSLLGVDYCYAIQTSRICLGLLSVQNRDLHTTRSLEIPSLGSLLCAQRTVEHEELYTDGEEAVFWNTPDECADLCHELLRDESRRARIAARGRERFLANGHRTDRLLTRIVQEAFA